MVPEGGLPEECIENVTTAQDHVGDKVDCKLFVDRSDASLKVVCAELL